jgi:hypothetical protein
MGSALCLLAGPAYAASTIGSSLTGDPVANDPGCNAGVPCTAANILIPSSSVASGGSLSSPVNGTVTSWRASANTGNNLSLQVLRPPASSCVPVSGPCGFPFSGGATLTGIATSAPENWPGPGVSPSFATSLPIQEGDVIGLLNRNQNLIFAGNGGGVIGVWYQGGPLADGSTRAPDTGGNSREVLVQATIEPTNTVTFGAVTLNKKKGTAKLRITVPNRGALGYSSGEGVRVVGTVGLVDPGDFPLIVKATGKKLEKLTANGKVRVAFSVRFLPSQGTEGTTVDTLMLRRKHTR